MSRTAAEVRLRRLLVMLPWLMERGSALLVDVAERFAMPVDEVVADLELVAMCGLPPYTDEMIDVYIDDDEVVVGVPRVFTRPLRLTAPEAFSLLAAGRAASELPGVDPDGPLARALDKVAAALGRAGLSSGSDGDAGSDVAIDDTAGVVIDLDRPELTDELTDAVAAGTELAIVYFSPASEQRTERSIVPRHVFVEGDHWYVRASDDRSDADRTFRIDRIESLRATGRTVPVDQARAAPVAFFADVDVPRVTLRIAAGSAWMVDRYPVDRIDPVGDGATVEVELPVASDRWLARLLLRLGPDVEVVGGDGDAAGVGRAVAAEILANYR